MCKADGKYILSSERFDLDASIKEFKEKEISVIVDIETAYPLNMDDIMLTIKTDEKENEKDEL